MLSVKRKVHATIIGGFMVGLEDLNSAVSREESQLTISELGDVAYTGIMSRQGGVPH